MNRRQFTEAMSKRGWEDLTDSIADALELAGLAPWQKPEPEAPTYNHTRSDSRLTPCPECAPTSQPTEPGWMQVALDNAVNEPETERKASLEDLICEINQPLWRAAAFARLDELHAEYRRIESEHVAAKDAELAALGDWIKQAIPGESYNNIYGKTLIIDTPPPEPAAAGEWFTKSVESLAAAIRDQARAALGTEGERG
jgi:hypothetical protein